MMSQWDSITIPGLEIRILIHLKLKWEAHQFILHYDISSSMDVPNFHQTNMIGNDIIYYIGFKSFVSS